METAGLEPVTSCVWRDHGKLFDDFWYFLTVFAPFYILFKHLCPRCFRVVRGGVWYALWSEPLPTPCRCLLPIGSGSGFHVTDCLDCNSEDSMRQVIPVPLAAQELGAVNKNRNWSDKYTAAHRTTSLLWIMPKGFLSQTLFMCFRPQPPDSLQNIWFILFGRIISVNSVSFLGVRTIEIRFLISFRQITWVPS